MNRQITDIFLGIDVISVTGDADVRISKIEFDSRKIRQGDLFVATVGEQADGHQFIQSAINNGAVAVLCQSLPADIIGDVTYILVADTTKALGFLASNFYGCPSQKLKLVGVTGTNGKTTTATLLYRLFTALGYKVGLLSTVRNYVTEQSFATQLTTPDSLEVNRLMAMMVDAGCEYCFMEASSHAIVQNRIAGLEFKGGVFTNITHDHLDYHKTFDGYLKAKKHFFDKLPSTAFALVNSDDRNGSVMLQNTKAICKSYGLQSMADFRARVLENHFEGMLLEINGKELWSCLVGKFNAYNLLAVYGTAVMLGAQPSEVLAFLSVLRPVDGRFETIRSESGITAIVDYAHTPDALENVLSTINDIRSGAEQLIALVGAGGNRDKLKRPKMANVVAKMADKVILTSDNPRFEEPEDIINDMESGLDAILKRKALRVTDRYEAIKTAVFMAKPGDIILIPGKGHEDYQDVKGVKHHFNDKEIIMDLFSNL